MEDDGRQTMPISTDNGEEETHISGGEECGPGEAEDDAEEEAEVQRPLRDPGMPTQKEWDEHMLSHIPPRPWCPHCLRGKGKDSPSLRVKGCFAESLVPRIRMDYAFLTENPVECRPCDDGDDGAHDEAESNEPERSQTILVS